MQAGRLHVLHRRRTGNRAEVVMEGRHAHARLGRQLTHIQGRGIRRMNGAQRLADAAEAPAHSQRLAHRASQRPVHRSTRGSTAHAPAPARALRLPADRPTLPAGAAPWPASVPAWGWTSCSVRVPAPHLPARPVRSAGPPPAAGRGADRSPAAAPVPTPRFPS
ncbi:hypothetical protein G6F68_015475 [Rhizopus microsporus]|nr:hypothetical protein G6F68_015475 [Rhizopus microsporus]